MSPWGVEGGMVFICMCGYVLVSTEAESGRGKHSIETKVNY